MAFSSMLLQKSWEALVFIWKFLFVSFSAISGKSLFYTRSVKFWVRYPCSEIFILVQQIQSQKTSSRNCFKSVKYVKSLVNDAEGLTMQKSLKHLLRSEREKKKQQFFWNFWRENLKCKPHIQLVAFPSSLCLVVALFSLSLLCVFLSGLEVSLCS